MQSSIPDIDALNATYKYARGYASKPQAIVVLNLGNDQAALAWGTGDQPSQYSSLPLGLNKLAQRLVSKGRLSEMAMEQLIAEVEDMVMPLHASLPAKAKLFSQDSGIAELAQFAGMTDNAAPCQLPTDAVEHLFNRLVALAQGRPASQDHLPTSGHFSAALMVLRELLHHLGFEDITVIEAIGSAK